MYCLLWYFWIGWGFEVKCKAGGQKLRSETVVGEGRGGFDHDVPVLQVYPLPLELGLDGCVSIGGASGFVLVDIPAHLDTLALKAALLIKGHVLL